MTTSIFSKNSTQSSLQVNGVESTVFDSTGIVSGVDTGIRQITATVVSTPNAMTITLLPCTIQFRSATQNSGLTNQRVVSTPINIVIPAGATLGTVSGIQSRLIVVAIDNAGTVELAVGNPSNGRNFNESDIFTSTATITSSSSSYAVYSNTSRLSVPYRVVGYIESTQSTAGQWATPPTVVQGAGGQALDSMSSLGNGQSWQDVSASRAVSTTYYNTTGKAIQVSIGINATASSLLNVIINGSSFSASSASAAGQALYGTFIIPSGNSYSFSASNGASTILHWRELR